MLLSYILEETTGYTVKREKPRFQVKLGLYPERRLISSPHRWIHPGHETQVVSLPEQRAQGNTQGEAYQYFCASAPTPPGSHHPGLSLQGLAAFSTERGQMCPAARYVRSSPKSSGIRCESAVTRILACHVIGTHVYKPHLTPNLEREIHGMLGEVYCRTVQELSTLNLPLFQICKVKWRVRFILGQLASASQTYLQLYAKDKQFKISTSGMKRVRPPRMHSLKTLPPGVDRHFMVSLSILTLTPLQAAQL